MSPMSAELSPRPWHMIDYVDPINHGRRVIGGGRVVADCSALDADTNDANAALIVRCVNRSDAVDALVEAARWFVSDDYDPDEARQPLERLRAALAKLTEGDAA